MKKILFLAVATFTLATCAQTEGVNEIVSSQLLISPVLTRVTDTAFEDGDQIGVTITTSDGTAYATNVPFTYGSSVFSGSLTWFSDSGASTIVAYYPYDESGLPTSFTVASDQTSGLSASDFIAGTATGVTPSESAVAVNFKHQLSKILVKLDNASASSVSTVKLTGSVLTADVDVAALTASVSSSEAGDITAYEAIEDSLYSAIVVPQTVALGLSVTLASGTELTTELASTTLLQGGQYTVNATVEDESITVYLSSEVEDWTDDGEVGPGSDETEINLSVSPTSVSVAAAGESFTVTVTCDTDYSVDISDDWLNLESDNAGTLAFTAEANSSGDSRTATITVTAGDLSSTVEVTQDAAHDVSGTLNGYEYVDLGLSVKWATCNIGADSPKEYGNYYAWAETETKSKYTPSTSICYSISDIDNISGDPEYDAATANWGSMWRMPTYSEISELEKSCTGTWTTQNGVKGCKVTGPNGNSIFLPAAGYRDSSSLRGAGSYGYYLCSTLPDSDFLNVYTMCSVDSYIYPYPWSTGRYMGFSVRPISDDMSDTTGSLDGHEYVDLGLSVKWATCNVGADSPEEYGDYFAWGETETKGEYTENNCLTYSILELDDFSGDAEYDAATANWGSPWRMPTSSEIDELISNCTWTWTTFNDVNGYEVTGTNGNSIFLPAAGFRYSSSLIYAGSLGSYWSSTPDSSGTSYAYILEFSSGGVTRIGYYRPDGLSIRPVSG